MITITAIYTGGSLGRFKNEPMYAVLNVKIKHGKVRKVIK